MECRRARTDIEAGIITEPVPVTLSDFLSAPVGKREPGGLADAGLFAGAMPADDGECSIVPVVFVVVSSQSYRLRHCNQ